MACTDLDKAAPAAGDDRHLHEECGVFGVWAPGEDVAKLTYYGLYALQHRGQEAAGIAVADGSQILVFKDLGLVSQVFDEQTLSSLVGHIAVGHCRYSTTGSTTWENAQPTFAITDVGSGIALGHNGNLVNATSLRVKLEALAGLPEDEVAARMAAIACEAGFEVAVEDLDPAETELDESELAAVSGGSVIVSPLFKCNYQQDNTLCCASCAYSRFSYPNLYCFYA